MVCRFQPAAWGLVWKDIPGGLVDFFSITATAEEVSVVCAEEKIDDEILQTAEEIERDWRMLKIAGPLDFDLIGVLAKCTTVLAEAQVPVFCLSTFLTDYILVKEPVLSAAIGALRLAGHLVEDPLSSVKEE